MKRTLIALTLLVSLVLVSCDQSTPSGPDSSPMNKATVTRDVPFSIDVHNTCCWEDEYVTISGTGKLVLNDNGAHWVGKDLGGTCIWGGHTYTTEGATTVKATYIDDKTLHVVIQVKLVNEDGCSATVKIHFKWVYSETDGWVQQFDKSELICDE